LNCTRYVPWTAQSRCNGCRLWDCARIQVFFQKKIFYRTVPASRLVCERECARKRGRERERGDRLCARACVCVCAARMRVREIHVRGVHVCICVPPHPRLPSAPPALSRSATPNALPSCKRHLPLTSHEPHNNLLVLCSPSCLLPLASCLRALTSLLSATVVLAYVCVIELLFLNLIF